MQGNRQTLLRTAGREPGTSQGPPHRSLAAGTLGLPPHLTDHFDLHGNKYIFNLSLTSVITVDFWGNKVSIQIAVAKADSMHKIQRGENISPVQKCSYFFLTTVLFLLKKEEPDLQQASSREVKMRKQNNGWRTTR